MNELSIIKCSVCNFEGEVGFYNPSKNNIFICVDLKLPYTNKLKINAHICPKCGVVQIYKRK